MSEDLDDVIEEYTTKKTIKPIEIDPNVIEKIEVSLESVNPIVPLDKKTPQEIIQAQIEHQLQINQKHLDEKEIYEPTGRSWVSEMLDEMIEKNIDEDLFYFYWYDYFINPEMAADPLPLGECHKEWSKELAQSRSTLHLDPRDHLKTSFITIGRALWNILERKFAPGMLIFESETNVTDAFETIKRHLTENQRILDFYGNIINHNRAFTAEKMFFYYQPLGDKNPGLSIATFFGKQVTGKHPKWANLDDIQDRAMGGSLMNKATHIIEAVLIPALGNKGELTIVGTIKGFSKDNDIYLYLMAKNYFTVFIHPAVYEIESGKAIRDENGYILGSVPEMKDIEATKKYVSERDKNGKIVRYRSGKRKGKRKMIMRFVIKITENRYKYKSLYPERYSVEDIVEKRLQINNDDRFFSEYLLSASNPKGRMIPVNRIGTLPPPGYPNLKTFFQHLKDEHIHAKAWIDDGTKKGHGLAISVAAYEDDRMYLLECIVFRGGTVAAGHLMYQLIKQWNIDEWANEPNFGQAELYGEPIESALEEAARQDGRPDLAYKDTGRIHPNTGEKIMRIKGTASTIIGIEGTPIKFYVNPNCASYDVLMREIKNFPLDPKGLGHEYDCLDTITSNKLHLGKFNAFAIWGLGSKDNKKLFKDAPF